MLSVFFETRVHQQNKTRSRTAINTTSINVHVRPIRYPDSESVRQQDIKQAGGHGVPNPVKELKLQGREKVKDKHCFECEWIRLLLNNRRDNQPAVFLFSFLELLRIIVYLQRTQIRFLG